MRKRDADKLINKINMGVNSKLKLYVTVDDLTGEHLIRYVRNGERVFKASTWDKVVAFLSNRKEVKES